MRKCSMTIKFKVNGQNWKIKTVTQKEMQEQKSDDVFAGLCVPQDRTIYIDNESVDFQTICHELVHAYYYYLHLDDTTTLPIGDYEEITASWFTANAEELIKKAKQLTKELQKGKE